MIKFPYKPRHNESTTKLFYMGHGRGTKICTYCQKLGHTIDVCFKKHGLSPYLRKTNVAQLSSSEDTKDDTLLLQLKMNLSLVLHQDSLSKNKNLFSL